MGPAEIARVPAPGGAFLTEQCGRLWTEIDAYLPRRLDYGDHFPIYRDGLAAAGLKIIDARQNDSLVVFPTLGDLVFMLASAPWYIIAFDPLGADLGALVALERDLLRPEGLLLSDPSYVVEARKPA